MQVGACLDVANMRFSRISRSFGAANDVKLLKQVLEFAMSVSKRPVGSVRAIREMAK